MKKIILPIVTSLTILLSAPLLASASPLAYPIERLSGQDRIDTALSISQKGWTSADTVILCEYSDFPDSIASTPFAVSQNAPILLTQGNTLDPRVAQELKRLQPHKVVLLGGTGVLKPSIEKELEQYNFISEIERIGGADRYETSILLAKRIHSESLILANGDDFPDALSAASFAGIKQIPIVLTSKVLPDSVYQYINEVNPEQVIVIGGEGVILSAGLAQHNIEIDVRLGGQDRYETNAKVISYVGESYQADDLFLASGITFPDAVAGTVLAAKYKAPLLLSEKEDIPPAVYTFMREHMKVEPPQSESDPVSTPSIGKGIVKAAGGLNLRETTSATGNKLITVPYGSIVDLVEKQGDWYKAKYQGKTGWLAAEYVTLTDSAGSSGETQVVQGVIAASGGLNLRETAASSGNVLVTIPQGTTVNLTEKQGEWYKATYQGKTGWLAAEYITVSGSANSTPVQTPASNGKVTAAGGLKLRETPSSTGKVLSTIPEGSTIKLIEKQDNWYKTTYQTYTGWVSADYISLLQTTSATLKISATINIDLSVNGTVYILGGEGVIGPNTQKIIEGKVSSKYTENLREFPTLPSEIKRPDQPSRGDTPSDPNNPSPDPTYDPSSEVLVDPFEDIPANALNGKIIMIDPGHGGPDVGAIGASGTYEKNNTLKIALELKSILQQAGATVLLTRDNDRSPAANYSEIEDLEARVSLANQSNAELFISIHNDSFTNPATQGTTVFYSSSNPNLLESVHLAGSIRTAVNDSIHSSDRGVKQANFYVVRYTKMPAVLIETSFISNPYEEARLQNPAFQKNVAAGIFRGIYSYYSTPLPKD